MYCFRHVVGCLVNRTKWKRQNQLRLDQLRQSAESQSDATTEYGQHKQQQHQRLHAVESHHHGRPPQVDHRYMPTAGGSDSDVQTAEASAAAAAASSPSSAAAAAAAAAFIGTHPYQGAANGARWNFLTTAAAIVRNVSYVHGCHM